MYTWCCTTLSINLAFGTVQSIYNYLLPAGDEAVARHHAIAGKLMAELHIHTIRINMPARLSVIFDGYDIGSVMAQYLCKEWYLYFKAVNFFILCIIRYNKIWNFQYCIIFPCCTLAYLSILITHRFKMLAVVPSTSRLWYISQRSFPNIHFFAIASSIALKI